MENSMKKPVTVASEEEAKVLQKMKQLSPTKKVEGFLERISKIQDSGQYEKYRDRHTELMEELSRANNLLPEPREKPGVWVRLLLMIPYFGKRIRRSLQKRQFEQGETINKIQMLLNKVDKSYAVLRNDIEPSKQLLVEFQQEANTIRGEIAQVEEFAEQQDLSPEASDFVDKYIQQQKISLEEVEHTFVPWLQEIINSSEKLYLNYASERKSLAMSLSSTAKILQKVGVVEDAADGLLVLRDTKKRSKLLASKAIARMRAKTAEVDSKLLHSLEEFAQVKALDEKSLKEAEQIKLKGEQEMKELEKRIHEFRLENRGGLSDDLKLQLPGGGNITFPEDSTKGGEELSDSSMEIK